MWTICWLCSWSRGWRGAIWICKFGNYCRGEEKLQSSIKILKCLKWKTCKKKPINLSFFTLFLWEKKTLMNLNYRRFNLNQILPEFQNLNRRVKFEPAVLYTVFLRPRSQMPRKNLWIKKAVYLTRLIISLSLIGSWSQTSLFIFLFWHIYTAALKHFHPI